MKRKTKNGFSLIEILIVVTIIGILMAIIMPTYKGIASKGRAVKCQANLKNLHTATMLRVKASSRYPNAISRVWERDDSYIEQRIGWVTWITTASKEQIYANPSLGVTEWLGDNGYMSVTNGSLWSYTGKSIECYSCPEFKVTLDKTTAIDSGQVHRTYVFNRALDEKNAFRVKRMSATLMFGEGAIAILLSPPGDGDETGHGWNNENKWDGCFMPGKWVESTPGKGDWHFEKGRNSEVLGHYHKDGTSYAVFCDGHIEKIRKVNGGDDEDGENVLFGLCEGKILKRNEF
ncbi:MAG: type II secretion system protein [Kiritimatiellae bacterium]|jgi:prepilin-type N-terminal cleavage/methylation domain-containing protein|nr:type II secretion system protein [Kiritimatiellia bacterium]